MAKNKKAKPKVYQTGKQSKAGKFIDKHIKAKPPGKRKSASGKTYFERRANRSDMPGTMMSIGKVETHYKKMLISLLGEKMAKEKLEPSKRKKAALRKEISVLSKKIKSI